MLVLALACVLISGALAAALNVWGLREIWEDFVSENEAKLPAGSGEYIREENITAEDGFAVYTLTDSYYDGNHLSIAVKVAPKERVFLLDSLLTADEPVYFCGPKNLAVPEEDGTTIARYALEHYDGRAAAVSISVQADDGLSDSGGGADTYMLNEDGTTTYFCDMELDGEGQPERKVLVQIGHEQGTAGSGTDACFEQTGEEETVVIPLTVTPVEQKRYVWEGEMDLPDAHVRLRKITLTVTPLEINYVVEGSATDREKMSEYLAFEFVDPDRAETEPDQKAYAEGPRAFSNGGSTDRGFYMDGSVCLDALGERYAIRAYDCYTRERFDTAVFTVTEQ